jgi:hypothetical protein
MCPKVMDYIKILVQLDKVVEDFKLNLLVLKKIEIWFRKPPLKV